MSWVHNLSTSNSLLIKAIKNAAELIILFLLHLGFNEPDVIKEATAASKDAMKVSETVKQAPSIVNQPDLCCVLF